MYICSIVPSMKHCNHNHWKISHGVWSSAYQPVGGEPLMGHEAVSVGLRVANL